MIEFLLLGMEQEKYRYYRDWASMSWLAAALLVAVGLSLFLEASRRETLFYIVFIVGCVVLVRLNQRRDKVQPQQGSSVAPAQDLVQELLAGEKLSAQEGREWLDRLLVEQQEEDQK